MKESPDKTKSAARDHLSGALKEAIKKEDDDISDLDLLPTPIKNLMSSGLSPFSNPPPISQFFLPIPSDFVIICP